MPEKSKTIKSIRRFAQNFADIAWQELRLEGLEGVGVTGSFARKGDFSLSRPDINFAFFTASTSRRFLWKTGRIVTQLGQEYNQFFNLRPEFHPERFAYPFQRDKSKIDLFFKVAFFEKDRRDDPFPFGRPPHVLEGHQLSLQQLHGKNYLAGIKIKTDNANILRSCIYVLSQWQRKIKLAPLSYNLTKDTDLFFNEVLTWGKLAIMQYLWIQGIKQGLDYRRRDSRQKILNLVHHKRELPAFFRKSNGKNLKQINFVLLARDHYQVWKNDLSKAKRLYFIASTLLESFLKEAQKLQTKIIPTSPKN